MAVYSMTGYATAQRGAQTSPGETQPGSGLGTEIRSVNSRFLDLSFKLPDDLRSAEPALRELLTTRLKRGKVEVRAWIEGRSDGAARMPSPAEIQRLLAVQDGILAWNPTAAPLSVGEVLGLCGRQTSGTQDLPAILVEQVGVALETLIDSRQREGARLADMLIDRLRQLRKLAKDAAPLIPQLVEQQRQRFLDRWQEAMGSSGGSASPEQAQDRALTEATAYAIRIDVAEELTRLDSHLPEI